MNSLERGEYLDISDAEYVRSSRNGSPEDFRLLVERYQRPLFAYLAGRLGNPTEAEEAAQESCVRASLGLKKLRQPDSFYSWLLGIAGRVLKEEFRSRQRRQRDCAAAESLSADVPEPPPEYPLEEAIGALPESYRQVILLRYYESLSCQEIADRLETPLGTVTKTLSRAYALLRQELKARENTDTTVNQTQTNELR